MKYSAVKKCVRAVLYICLLYLIYVIAAFVIPPAVHHNAVEGKITDIYSASNSSGYEERILCIDDNTQALMWRLRLIESARDDIAISTFEWVMDESGTDIAAALLAAADRGVNVRILVDGMDGRLRLANDPLFHALLSSENVQMKFYNPIEFLTPWKWNYRLHDKYFIADDSVYILGGRNIGNLFMGDYGGRKNIDRDILVYEPDFSHDSSLQELRAYFDNIWQQDCCREQYAPGGRKTADAIPALREYYNDSAVRMPDAFGDVDWMGETAAAGHIGLLTNPVDLGTKEPKLWNDIVSYMQSGSRVTIITPYVICDRTMINDLTSLNGDGRDVTMIVNDPKSGANIWGGSDFLNRKDDIIGTGIKVYAYSGNDSQHTKTVLVDDDISIVGSFNCDMRSVYLDTEMMLVIDSPELHSKLESAADAAIKGSARLYPTGEVSCGEDYIDATLPAGRKVLYFLLRIVSIPIRHLL